FSKSLMKNLLRYENRETKPKNSELFPPSIQGEMMFLYPKPRTAQEERIITSFNIINLIGSLHMPTTKELLNGIKYHH
ncbi:hypothetical protein ACJX0J_021555, partial [Zea mays]